MSEPGNSERKIPPVGDPTPPIDPDKDPITSRLKKMGITIGSRFDRDLIREGRLDLRVEPQSLKFTLERVAQGVASPEDAEKVIRTREANLQRRIERLKREGERLAGEAMFDQLTGLPNRRSYELQLKNLIASGTPFGATYGDIDLFKQVNDKYGHAGGDLALQTVANALSESVRPEDSVIRYGGDEFIMLFPGIDNEDELFAAADRARATVASQSIPTGEGKDFSATMSIGGGIFRGNNKGAFDQLKERIDNEGLLQGAKKTRNSVVIIR